MNLLNLWCGLLLWALFGLVSRTYRSLEKLSASDEYVLVLILGRLCCNAWWLAELAQNWITAPGEFALMWWYRSKDLVCARCEQSLMFWTGSEWASCRRFNQATEICSVSKPKFPLLVVVSPVMSFFGGVRRHLGSGITVWKISIHELCMNTQPEVSR